MRILRTEMYFDAKSIALAERKFQPFPGVSVAWIRLDHVRQPSGTEIQAWLSNDRFPVLPVKDPVAIFSTFFDVAVRGVPSDEATPIIQSRKSDPRSEKLAHWFLHQEIVIEQSPPTAEQLIELLKRGSGWTVGTWVGWQVAAAIGYYPLLIGTVPLGIILIGGAIGVGEGLRAGLHARIEEWIKTLGK
jgi:hypothetical protein